MNIYNSLQSAEKIKEILGRFPKHPRQPPIEEWYSKSVLEEANKELLRKCIPFTNKIIKEIKSSIDDFDADAIKRIETRRDYIQKQLEEARKDKEVQNKKRKIISEIEALEKLNIQPFEKIVIDEMKSLSIIEYLFESRESSGGNEILKNFIEFTFERNTSNRIDSYEKILQILQNEQQQ